jgi:hypothetical protein
MRLKVGTLEKVLPAFVVVPDHLSEAVIADAPLAQELKPGIMAFLELHHVPGDGDSSAVVAGRSGPVLRCASEAFDAYLVVGALPTVEGPEGLNIHLIAIHTQCIGFKVNDIVIGAKTIVTLLDLLW